MWTTKENQIVRLCENTTNNQKSGLMIDKNKYTNTWTRVITTTGIGGFANGQLCKGYVAYPKPPPTNKL